MPKNIPAVCLIVALALGSSAEAKKMDAKDGKKDAAAESSHAARREKPERALSVEFFDKRLDLDGKQGEEMRGLLLEYGKEQIMRDGEIRYMEIGFLESFDEPSPDYDKLEAAYRDLSARQADMKSYALRKLLEAKRFLNDDQFGKYKNTLITIFLR